MYFFDKRRYKRTIFHEIIRTREFFKVIIDFGEAVNASRNDNYEKSKDARKSL